MEKKIFLPILLSVFLLSACARCQPVCPSDSLVSSSSLSAYPTNYSSTRGTGAAEEGHVVIYNEEDSYRGKVHYVEAEGKKIYTELAVPRGFDETQKHPLVIMSHGFDSLEFVYDYYLQEIVPSGYPCLRFDFCGGRLSGCRSSGSFSDDMSVMTEVEDLRIITEYAKTLAFVDSSKIVLIGESQGGLVTALRAAKAPEDYVAHIDLYPAYLIPDLVRAQYSSLAAIPEHPTMYGATVGRRYMSDVFDLDSWSEIAKFSKPVFLYHGDEDMDTPLSVSEKAQPLYPNATLTIIPNEGHGFSHIRMKIFVADCIVRNLIHLGL